MQSNWHIDFFRDVALEFWRRAVPASVTRSEADFLEKVFGPAPKMLLDRLEEVLVLLSRQELEMKKETGANTAPVVAPPAAARAPAKAPEKAFARMVSIVNATTALTFNQRDRAPNKMKQNPV